ncbi:hypothetical protein KKH13_04925 [Patescibacteria group bacterium]|nr:hypothetical protein [Patescibacteria group bacterium]
MKIFHHNDLDGRCAGAIALRWARQNHIILESNLQLKLLTVEVDYKDKIDQESISPGEYIIVVDFSFKPEVMIPLLQKGIHVTWIDHHKTAAEYDYKVKLPGLRDFSDKGSSGCELAWRHFNPTRLMPKSVELIGDYDKWALKLQPECFQFYEGLKLEVTIPQSALWDHLFSGNEFILEDILKQGHSAVRYRDNYCDKICNDFGYEIELDGKKGFATNFYQFGSKGFGKRVEQYDFCAAYIHDGKRFTVSLYSIKDIDVSEICKKYGGGGHRGAAGFVCQELPFSR